MRIRQTTKRKQQLTSTTTGKIGAGVIGSGAVGSGVAGSGVAGSGVADSGGPGSCVAPSYSKKSHDFVSTSYVNS